jgi:hypothetical protein
MVVKSVVLNLFSLLGSSSSSNVAAGSFGCVVILSLYLKQIFLIFSLIVGTFNSVCKTLFYTMEHLLLLGGLYFYVSVIFQYLNY